MHSLAIETGGREAVPEAQPRPSESSLARHLNKLLGSGPEPEEHAPPPEAPRDSGKPAVVEPTVPPPSKAPPATRVPRRKLFALLRRRRTRGLPRARRIDKSRNSAPWPKPQVRPRLTRPGGHHTRHRVMVTLIPILAITLVTVLKQSVGGPASAEAAGAESRAPAPPESPPAQIVWTIPPLYDLQSRDPMRLPSPAVAEVELPAPVAEVYVNLQVTGILHSEDRPAAIVNTKVVREGQQVDGVNVVKITTESVEFELNGRRWSRTVGDGDLSPNGADGSQ